MGWPLGCVILFENPNINFGIWNQVVLMYNKEAPKVESVNFLFLAALFSPKISTTPFITQKFFVPFIGFMVLKTTGLSSQFEGKTQFWKICTECWDIGQNVRIYGGLVWRPEFWHNFANITGTAANFSKPIFALKPWAQAGHFEYHKPYNQNEIFFDL